DGLLDPRTRRLEPFSLMPALRGARALTIGADQPPFATTSPAAKRADRRSVTLSGRLPPDGPARLDVTEALAGWPATEWREALDHIDPDRVRQDFEQRSLGFFFPGAQLDALEFRHRDLGP